MENFSYKIEENKFYIYVLKEKTELDYSNLDEFRYLINLGIKKGYASIYLNCENLLFLDSSGLRVLLFTATKMPVTLLNVNDNLQRIFKITNTEKSFNFV